MRALMTRALVLCCLLPAVAWPAVAGAQGNPFGPITPAVPPPTQTQTTPTTPGSPDTSGDGLGTTSEILIFLAGVVLIGGIGFAIVRDARRKAPVTEDEAAGAHQTHGKSAGTRKAQTKAQARKKGKAAKAARRHNRPR